MNKRKPTRSVFLPLYLQVLRILAWDTKNHLVYYIGTLDKKPGQQHLYIVKDPLNKDNGRYVWLFMCMRTASTSQIYRNSSHKHTHSSHQPNELGFHSVRILHDIRVEYPLLIRFYFNVTDYSVFVLFHSVSCDAVVVDVSTTFVLRAIQFGFIVTKNLAWGLNS